MAHRGSTAGVSLHRDKPPARKGHLSSHSRKQGLWRDESLCWLSDSTSDWFVFCLQRHLFPGEKQPPESRAAGRKVSAVPRTPRQSLLLSCAPADSAPAAAGSAVVQLPNPHVPRSCIPGQKEPPVGRIKSRGVELRASFSWEVAAVRGADTSRPSPGRTRATKVPKKRPGCFWFSPSTVLGFRGCQGSVPSQPPVTPTFGGVTEAMLSPPHLLERGQ